MGFNLTLYVLDSTWLCQAREVGLSQAVGDSSSYNPIDPIP